MILQDVRPSLFNDVPQWKQIEDHLKSGKKLTKLEALRNFGCMQLGTRINELRMRYGHDKIHTEMIKVGRKTFAEYSWVGNEEV